MTVPTLSVVMPVLITWIARVLYNTTLSEVVPHGTRGVEPGQVPVRRMTPACAASLDSSR